MYLNKFEKLSAKNLEALLATVPLNSVRLWYYVCHRWRQLKLLQVRLLTATLFLDYGLNIYKIITNSLHSVELFDTIFLSSPESFPMP